MKKKIINSILVLLLISIICTSTIYGYNSQEKYEYDDPNVSYKEYLYHNSPDMNQQLTSRNVIGLLARKYNIDLTEIGNSSIINYYYTGHWHLTMANRMQTLIDIMRFNMLIPDPDKTKEYSWTDIPRNISDQELAYINYAKELGITNGTGDFTFGFSQSITYSQFNTFITNIENIENLSQYKVSYPLTIIDTINCNNEKLAAPLIVEYFYTLPDKLVNKLSNWTFYLDGDNIPSYDNAVGITIQVENTIEIISIDKTFRNYDFNETMIHEFGHAISWVGNRRLVNGIYPDTNILEEEMPKLPKGYRSYAGENSDEYFACAWYWNYHIGDTLFSSVYPYTYELFQSILDNYR